MTNTNHTAEEVRANVAENRRHMTTATEAQLTAYAALLELSRKGVTEDAIAKAAMALAQADGCDPHELIWEGNPPEPWGEVWNKYERTARAALEAVWPVAAEPRAVPDEWQPIETAPKSVTDGKHVDGIYLLGFVPDKEVADPQACIDIIWWEPLLRNNSGGRGKWCRSAGDEQIEVKPTLWTSLPAAPQPGEPTQESQSNG